MHIMVIIIIITLIFYKHMTNEAHKGFNFQKVSTYHIKPLKKITHIKRLSKSCDRKVHVLIKMNVPKEAQIIYVNEI